MKKLISLFALAAASVISINAQNVKMHRSANDPVGTPQGIHPGRVAWTHAPGAAKWPGKTDNSNWYEDRWNDQASADWLVTNAITTLTGENDGTASWNALFTYFNEKNHAQKRGYQKGEKVAIKVNMNNSYNYQESGEINASPTMVLALLRSLVNEAGVEQKCITVFDASRFLTDGIYLKCHAEFPDVNYVDHVGEEGRTKSGFVADAVHYSKESARMRTGLTTACTEADYIINMALLKGHVGQGITLCGKNWYGTVDIDQDWRKNAHTNMNQDKGGRFKYITFVDYMGHKDIGGKTMLYLIDGLYGCKLVDGQPDPVWQMAPFNGSWPCSLLASQDPVAIDSVGLDFIMSEFPDAPDLDYADMYLIEAAMAGNAPSGTVYDPEGDGTPLQSLGVAEHWNNAKEKKYTKIELIYKAR